MARHCNRCGKELTEYNSYDYDFCSDCKRQEDAEEKQAELAKEQRRMADEQRWIAEEQDNIRREEIAWNNALPKCKWCGKPYSFAPADHSFFEYCSRKCASEALGREKLDDYSKDVIPLVKEEINKAFQPNGNIHKAIVYSEGFSEYFTVGQHIIIVGAIQQHRSHFLSNSELEGLMAYHYEQAFLNGTLEQKIEFACTPWKNQLDLNGTSLPDCNLPVNLAFQYISRIFDENDNLPSGYVTIFEQVFKFVNDNDLKVSKKNCKNSLLCSIVDKEIRDREERKRQAEERGRQKAEELRRQEEERGRQKAEELRRQEEERKRQKAEERKRQVEVVAERKRQEEERKRQEEERKRQEEERRRKEIAGNIEKAEMYVVVYLLLSIIADAVGIWNYYCSIIRDKTYYISPVYSVTYSVILIWVLYFVFSSAVNKYGVPSYFDTIVTCIQLFNFIGFLINLASIFHSAVFS